MQTCPRDTAEEFLRGATVVQKTTVQRATVTCGRDHLGAALQNKLSPEEPPNRVVNRRVPTGLKDLIPARYLALLLSPFRTLSSPGPFSITPFPHCAFVEGKSEFFSSNVAAPPHMVPYVISMGKGAHTSPCEPKTSHVG